MQNTKRDLSHIRGTSTEHNRLSAKASTLKSSHHSGSDGCELCIHTALHLSVSEMLTYNCAACNNMITAKVSQTNPRGSVSNSAGRSDFRRVYVLFNLTRVEERIGQVPPRRHEVADGGATLNKVRRNIKDADVGVVHFACNFLEAVLDLELVACLENFPCMSGDPDTDTRPRPPAQQLTSAQIAFGLANFPLDLFVSSRFEKDTSFALTAVTRGELHMHCSDQR